MLAKVKGILNQTHDRETFFRIIASIYPTLDWRYRLIEKAYNDAKESFRGKYREDGERYFEHLRAVSLIIILYLKVTDYILIVAALLHDIVEDCDDWTIERVIKEYGEEVAVFIEWMSKPKDMFPEKEDYRRVYHERFTIAPREFFVLKLSDRLHNLLTMWACSPEKRKRKKEETKQYYIHYAAKHIILYHEIMAALEELDLENGLKKSCNDIT